VPIGSRHDETGRLRWERGALILLRDEGGRWRLEADRRAQRFVGQRVRVIGTRDEFDLLSVAWIEPC
jgi:hypothetical protein